MKTVSQLNKEKTRLFVEAVLNEGRLELIDELVAADYVGRIPCPEREVFGRDELRRLIAAGRLSHPNLYIKIDEQIAEDDLVAMRWRATSRAPRTAASNDAPRGWSGISIIHLLAGRQVDAYTAVTPERDRVAA